MHILIVNNTRIPVKKYGGTERIIWSLGKELARLGHKVSYLVKAGSTCPFADVYKFDKKEVSKKISLNEQIERIHQGSPISFVHCHFPTTEKIKLPHLFTIHGNGKEGEVFPMNTVFISSNHAERHSSTHFVYNGLDWGDYPKDLYAIDEAREGVAFLSDVKRPEKNLAGALEIAEMAEKKMFVMGGWKLNLFNKLFFNKLFFNSKVAYLGQVDNATKAKFLSRAEAMIFPVLWDEPFGLAPIEALFYGCPVFATPYGALPELITPAVDTNDAKYGILNTTKAGLAKELQSLQELPSNSFSPQKLREYVCSHFSHQVMTANYLKYYEKILSGEKLHRTPPKAQKSSDRHHLYSWS